MDVTNHAFLARESDRTREISAARGLSRPRRSDVRHSSWKITWACAARD